MSTNVSGLYVSWVSSVHFLLQFTRLVSIHMPKSIGSHRSKCGENRLSKTPLPSIPHSRCDPGSAGVADGENLPCLDLFIVVISEKVHSPLPVEKKRVLQFRSRRNANPAPRGRSRAANVTEGYVCQKEGHRCRAAASQRVEG